MSEQLSPERAVRLLRAKVQQLENSARVLLESTNTSTERVMGSFAADIALVASILADFMENANASLVLYEAHTENLIERVYALENGLESGDHD